MRLTKHSIIVACDFETLSTKTPSVYAWGLGFLLHHWEKKRCILDKIVINYLLNKEYISYEIRDDMIIFVGTTLQSFMTVLLNFKVEVNILFQNGARFDLHFLHYAIENAKSCEFTLFDNISETKLNSNRHRGIEDYKKYVDNARKRKIDNLLYAKGIRENHKNYEKSFKSLSSKFLPYDFKYLLNSNKYVSFTFKNGKDGLINFIDAYLQFPSSLFDKGRDINLEKLENEDGYNITEPFKSLKDYKNYKNEYVYLLRDVEILFKHTTKMYKLVGKNSYNDIKLTAASIAYNNWKTSFTTKVMNSLINNNIISKQRYITLNGKRHSCYDFIDKGLFVNMFKSELGSKPYKSSFLTKTLLNKVIFEKYFPHKWLDCKYGSVDNISPFIIETNNTILKKFYTGGIVLVNDRYENNPIFGKYEKTGKILASVDVNSSYPTIMSSDLKAPYGPPIFNKKSLDDKLFQFIELIPKRNIKSKCFPIVHNSRQKDRTWLTELLEGKTYYISSNSLKYIIKHYCNNDKKQLRKLFFLKITASFNYQPMNYFFKDFVDMWFKEKVKAKLSKNPLMTALSKLFLNSCYGKFGTKLYSNSHYFNKDKVSVEKYADMREGFFLPLACAITEGARLLLAEGVGDKFDTVVYTDTDCLKILIPFDINTDRTSIIDYITNNYNIKIDKVKLGCWDLETLADMWIIRRSKQYYLFNTKSKEVYLAHATIHWDKEYEFIKTDNILENYKKQKDLENFTKRYKLLKYNFFLKDITLPTLIEGITLDNQQRGEKVLGCGIYIHNTSLAISPIWNLPVLAEQRLNSKTKYLEEFNKNI